MVLCGAQQHKGIEVTGQAACFVHGLHVERVECSLIDGTKPVDGGGDVEEWYMWGCGVMLSRCSDTCTYEC